MLRTCVLSCALAGVVALAIGCVKSTDTKPTTTKKDEAVSALKVKMEELDKKAADLKERAEKATGDEKMKLEAKWKESTAKQQIMTKKLDELKAAAADKWEAVKKEADAAFDEFKKSVE